MEKNIRVRVGLFFATLVCLLALSLNAAPVPSPEKILPDDTLFVFTIPDFAKARETYKTSPSIQLWNDPAMKPFREKFTEKMKTDYLQPLERQLSVKLSDYTDLPQGQITFAVLQNGWQGKGDKQPAMLLLLDTKNKSDQLKKNLAELKKKWVDAGKKIRAEKIRDVEFSAVSISSEEVKAIKKALPTDPVEEIESLEDKAKQPKREYFIGQSDSLLIVSDTAKVAEKVLSRLSGGSVPALGDTAAYQSSHNSLFRDAPLYAWLNTKVLIDVLTKSLPAPEDSERAFAAFHPDKIIAATGISSVKTIAFSVNESPDGSMFNVFVSAPEASRQGVLKIIAGDAKETSPPAFVPADAVKFQRWRVDGQKAWATLERMFNEINPQIMGGINFLMETAATSAKEKNPDFDLKKSLIGNLGDDIVTYEKAARGNSAEELNSPPSLTLIGSPHPDQLAAAFKSLFVFLPSGGDGSAPKEREFLGRKIYSTALPSLPMASAKPGESRTLNYAASGGYLALSTDIALLEEYLRSSENPQKSLRETAGLAAATQKVTGAGTSWFGFGNQTETVRLALELIKKDPSILTRANKLSAIPTLGAPADEKNAKPWIDPTLLPSFDKISKYFHYSVYGISANVEGLSFKLFAPVPPQLKKNSEPAK
jgi:hypothetical protein